MKSTFKPVDVTIWILESYWPVLPSMKEVKPDLLAARVQVPSSL
jgi:hypothetical protein